MTTNPATSLQTIHAELEVLRSHNLVSMDQYFSILGQLPQVQSPPPLPPSSTNHNSTTTTTTSDSRVPALAPSTYADPKHGVTMLTSTGHQYTPQDFAQLRRGPGLPPPPLLSPLLSSSKNTEASTKDTDTTETTSNLNTTSRSLQHIEHQTFDPTTRPESRVFVDQKFGDASTDPENPACVKNPDHLDWAKRLGERLGSMAMMGSGVDDEGR